MYKPHMMNEAGIKLILKCFCFWSRNRFFKLKHYPKNQMKLKTKTTPIFTSHTYTARKTIRHKYRPDDAIRESRANPELTVKPFLLPPA